MAFATDTISTAAPTVPPVHAAPTVSESVPLNGARLVLLDYVNGATPTTVTITRPGVNPAGGDTRAPLVVAIGASTRQRICLTPDMGDSSGNVAVAHANVTTLTARLTYFY